MLYGRVIDAQSGESLPAATIQLEGSFQGTITNAEGMFSLAVEAVPAVLVVRYIGYATRRMNVTAAIVSQSNTDPLEIGLEPTVYLLQEVVVSDEDPAISIMQRVIERKKIWRAQLDGFRAEAYNRFTLRNDTGIVSILESFTESYWSKDEGMREIVKARRQTSNLEIEEYLPAAQFVANLYDDNLDIAGYTFVGVTNPNAFDHYRFELIGYRQIDDQLVYDIRVTPRNRLKTAFQGQVAVLDEAYALLEVALEPGDAFLFPPPIQGLSVTYEQQFSNFGGDFWLPVDFRSRMQLDVGFNRLLTFPTIYIDQVSKISNYEINRAAPDSLFAEGETVVVDSASVQQDDVLDRAGVAVPLDRAEVRAYETVDSTMTLAKAYQPTGPLARFVDMDDDEDGSGEGGRRGDGPSGGIDLNLRPMVRYNRVEELYGELGIRQPIGSRLTLQARVGGGTGQSGEARVSYGAGGELDLGPRERWRLSLDYGRYTDTQSESTPMLQLLNSAFTLFGETDYFDYYRNRRLRGMIGYNIRSIDTRFLAGIHLERHRSLEKTTDYDLLAGNDVQRLNPAVEEGMLRSLVASIQIGERDENLGLAGSRRLQVEIEHSDPGLLPGDFSFTRYRALFDWRVETFFKRRLLPNTLDLRLYGQTYSGDLPIQRYGVVEARIGFLNRFGALQTGEGIPYRGASSLGLFWEHNFKTVPFEVLRMNRLARQALNLIVFGGHGRAWRCGGVVPSSGDVLPVCPGWHHEIGVSLSGVFSLFRIDFAKRLDASGFAVGVGAARIF